MLHWVIVVLVAAQFATGDAMVELWQTISGARTAVIPFATQIGEAWHMSSGLTILFLAAMLLLLRGRHGSPALPDMPPALAALALWTHRAFYFVLIVLPMLGTGAAAGIATAALLHVILTKVLLVLIALHVVGALWHLVIRRDGVMRSMVVPKRDGG
jgi:cytochrome b561